MSAQVKPFKTPERKTLRSVVSAYVKNATYKDYEDLADQLEDLINSDTSLVPQAVRYAAYDLARHSAGTDVRRVVQKSAISTDDADHLERFSNQCAKSLLDSPIAFGNGKRLRDARQQDLMHAVEGYRSQMRSAAVASRWYSMIASKVGSRTVGDAFTENKLKELYRKAEVDAA